jgi:hypothetical protein
LSSSVEMLCSTSYTDKVVMLSGLD